MLESPVSPFTPLLRVPPFPGSRPKPLVRPAASPPEPSEDELDRAIDAIASARVGGDYWGLQPPLPQTPYILVKVRNEQARARLVQTLRSELPLLCWIDALSDARRSESSPTTIVSGRCDPWHLVSGASEIFADLDDELVLIASLCGVPAHGPDGRDLSGSGAVRAAPRDLIRNQLVGRFAYASPFTGETIGLTEAIELCAFWRRLIDSNRPITAAIGFAAWKRPTAAPLLWAGATGVPFTARPRGVANGDQIVAWKSRVADAMLAQLECDGARLIEVEDGFIRSVGLGADCVPPLSLVVDRLGIFFDPHRPSELEELLQKGDFPPDLLDRAHRLRHLIIEAGVTKYGTGHQPLQRRAEGRRHLLVAGQVEDDRSVLCGGGAVGGNLDLLKRARNAAPDAYILYKPHPDVEAGHRVGAIPEEVAASFADEVVRNESIPSLIDMVDEVHVNTSLAGFEALIRGKAVTAHGVPFYSGWGLTRDLGAATERRTARRTLDELVAAVLLLYPRYLDPVTGLPCTPEILIRRLVEGAGVRAQGPLVPLRRLQGYVKRRVASLRAW